jgi:uncharacterized protein (DUF2164 family)
MSPLVESSSWIDTRGEKMLMVERITELVEELYVEVEGFDAEELLDELFSDEVSEIELSRQSVVEGIDALAETIERLTEVVKLIDEMKDDLERIVLRKLHSGQKRFDDEE